MNFGPRKMQISIAAMPAIRISPSTYRSVRELLRDPLQPHRARALDQDRIARPKRRGERVGGGLGVRHLLVGLVRGGLLPHPDDQLDPTLACVLADLAVVGRGLGAELPHLSEHGDAPSPASSVARWSSAARIEIGLAL